MKLLSYSDLRDHSVPYTRVHLKRLEDAGKFPRRVRLSENRVAWLADEVEGWLAARIAERYGVKVT